MIPASNCPLLQFARAGYATAVLDTKDDPIIRWRGYVAAEHRGGQGALGDAVFFAKYHYNWGGQDFILYTIGTGYETINYLLCGPDKSKGEDTLSHCAVADALIFAAVKAAIGDENQFVYVYDRFWMRSKELWEQVQKASWDKVILDPAVKKSLQDVAGAFFDSEEIYKRYGVPWRRGLIFYGPPGNGKTTSLKGEYICAAPDA